MVSERRPFRVFVSGNCQAQFVYDALRFLWRDEPGIELTYRASYRPIRPGDEAAARVCDLHLAQVANLERDPWRELVSASARRLRFPVLLLTGVFHALAPRVHPGDPSRGRPPFYLARGNTLLHAHALRFRRGEVLDPLLDSYLNRSDAAFAGASRLLDLNIASMRRVAREADLDPWRAIEPRLHRERLFWSVKHPTLAASMLLLRPLLAALDLPYDTARLAALAAGPEYHEPYHAPVHPALAARLGLAWAGPETRYRFFAREFTAAEHARRFIAGDFAAEFALNRTIRDARSRADDRATAAAFRRLPSAPCHGQAEFWHGRVLQRLGQFRPAIASFEAALAALRAAPFAVSHRADTGAARIAACHAQCRRALGGESGSDRHARETDIAQLQARLDRLEAYEAYLEARIRWHTAREGRAVGVTARDAAAKGPL